MQTDHTIRSRQVLTGAVRRWMRHLPIVAMFGSYRAGWLKNDIIAGLVLTTMLVPVGIAYAEASGVPGVCGLYATIVRCSPMRSSARAGFSCSVPTRRSQRPSSQSS
ncbi:hypothetical protein NK8_82930 (plasmid) [Caballeronia sp. NK8]|nr:hypothetical protein NK8_67690 [Caballeronia sp. NK8]BCQ30102.1 hypothetical protein NK8_82930 [Caballeronia sp. NK8]